MVTATEVFRTGLSERASVNVSEPVSFIAIMPQTVPSPPQVLARVTCESEENLKPSIKKGANAYFVKMVTKGPITISLFLSVLMKLSLNPGARRSLEYLLSSDNLSILYEDLLHSVDFPLLVEANSGFDIDVLSFGLIVRVIRI